MPSSYGRRRFGSFGLGTDNGNLSLPGVQVMTCKAVDEEGRCSSAPDVGEECRKHYARRRRHGTYYAVQPKRIEDGEKVSFVLETTTRAQVLDLAERRGVTEGTILREAVTEYFNKT